MSENEEEVEEIHSIISLTGPFGVKQYIHKDKNGKVLFVTYDNLKDEEVESWLNQPIQNSQDKKKVTDQEEVKQTNEEKRKVSEKEIDLFLKEMRKRDETIE